MAKQLFRKVALERMSSPEQLDQLITITTPVGWLALLAIGGLLVAAIFWGIYGSIPTQVQGSGIILKKEGMMSVQVKNSGKITKLNIEVGDAVEKGQIVARLQQDEILEKIRLAQLDLKNLETSFGEKRKTEEETKRIRLQELRQREKNLYQQIENLETQIHVQNELKNQKEKEKEGRERLVKEGIITESKVLEIENEIVGIQQNIAALRLQIEETKNQLNTIGLEIKKIEGTEVIDELTHSQQVERAKLEIQTLQKTFAENSQIVSPDRGRVLEIPVKEGDLVHSGSTIFLIERSAGETELEVIVYFSPLTGKQIERGMKAQISPSIVKQEEYGFMEGIVAEVDKYPSTFTDVMKTLQNESLARILAADAAPIKVKVSLIADADTPSGYKWSSRNGPPIEIDSGTIASISVTVKKQAPMTLVVPILKKFFFGIGESS
jgi:HlyD family secretion protein